MRSYIGSLEVLDCTCPAVPVSGGIWGSEIYTADSNVCRAAQHAGRIGRQGGEVRVRMLPGGAALPRQHAKRHQQQRLRELRLQFPLRGRAGFHRAATAAPCTAAAAGVGRPHAMPGHHAELRRKFGSAGLHLPSHRADRVGLGQRDLHCRQLRLHGRPPRRLHRSPRWPSSAAHAARRGALSRHARNGISSSDFASFNSSFQIRRRTHCRCSRAADFQRTADFRYGSVPEHHEGASPAPARRCAASVPRMPLPPPSGAATPIRRTAQSAPPPGMPAPSRAGAAR